MAYIDHPYYTTCSSVAITPEAFPAIAERASDMVDDMTRSVVERELLVEGDPLYTTIKRATAMQAEYIQASGGLAVHLVDKPVVSESESWPSYSHSKTYKSDSATPTVNGLEFSPVAFGLLSRSGLIGRGRRIS